MSQTDIISPEYSLTPKSGFFKALSGNYRPQSGGAYRTWGKDFLPQLVPGTLHWIPGPWTPDRRVNLCHSGWHLAVRPRLTIYADRRDAIFVAEGDGEHSRAPDHDNTGKTAFQRARLTEYIGRYPELRNRDRALEILERLHLSKFPKARRIVVKETPYFLFRHVHPWERLAHTEWAEALAGMPFPKSYGPPFQKFFTACFDAVHAAVIQHMLDERDAEIKAGTFKF